MAEAENRILYKTEEEVRSALKDYLYKHWGWVLEANAGAEIKCWNASEDNKYYYFVTKNPVLK